MKKIVIVGALGLSFLCIFNLDNVFAAEKKEINQDEEKIIEPFDDWDDSDKVLELPDGTFLKGQASFYGTKITDYDSKTDKNSITVREAKKLEEEKVKEEIIDSKRSSKVDSSLFISLLPTLKIIFS